MATAGSLPSASTRGTWVENIEIWSTDDEELADLSDVDEISVILQDPHSEFDEMTLTMSDGDVTLPSTGIIQWRAEQGVMQQLTPKLYNVIVVIEGEGDIVPFYVGTISIV